MTSAPIGGRFAWADQVAGDAIENSWALSPQSLDFALGLADRLGRYGAQTFISEPQLKWLKDIERTLVEEIDDD